MKPSSGEQQVIVYDPELCTGCRYCEVACSFKHYRVIDMGRSCIRVLFDSGDGAGVFEAVRCHHCEDAICVSVCPSEALSRDEETGWVRINHLKCIGCRMCVYLCPLSAPFFDEEHKVAMKCDFCEGDPECVKHCSSQALKIVSREEALRINKRLYTGANRNDD